MNKRLDTYSEQLELAFDPELREEYRKALSWIDMYKMNTDRIKALLSQNPITYGEYLINGTTGEVIVSPWRHCYDPN